MVSALSLLDSLKPVDIRIIPQARLVLPDIQTETRNGYRYYLTPDGDFPSVTSVLGSTDPKLWLDEWREKIGNEKADRITARSCERGERMHQALEERLGNNPQWIKACEDDAEAIVMAKCIAEDIIDDIDSIITTESALYSATLKVAGRIDCAGIIRGKPSILDFKNARRMKKADSIQDYFIQATLYSRMLREMTGIECDDLYIAMAFAEDHLGKSTIFHERYENWIGAAEERVRAFHEGS